MLAKSNKCWKLKTKIGVESESRTRSAKIKTKVLL